MKGKYAKGASRRGGTASTQIGTKGGTAHGNVSIKVKSQKVSNATSRGKKYG